jgi:hypothetical protein
MPGEAFLGFDYPRIWTIKFIRATIDAGYSGKIRNRGVVSAGNAVAAPARDAHLYRLVTYRSTTWQG